MGIHRSDKDKDPFTQISNFAVRDTRLTYRSLGILVRLLSNKDDWVLTSDQLRQPIGSPFPDVNKREGRDAIRKALKQLEDCGYRIVHRRRGEGGRFITEIEILERPVTDNQTSATPASLDEEPVEQEPDVGSVADQAILEEHEEDYEKDQKNTRGSKTSQKDQSPSVAFEGQEKILRNAFHTVLSEQSPDPEVTLWLKPFWTCLEQGQQIKDTLTVDQGLEFALAALKVKPASTGRQYWAVRAAADWLKNGPRDVDDLLLAVQQIQDVVKRKRSDVDLPGTGPSAW